MEETATKSAEASKSEDKASSAADPPKSPRKRGSGESFPDKLHRLLEYCETEGLMDVACFCVHGRAFAIHKPRRFVAEVMPHFFKQSKISSFQRQLNLYGFTRIFDGPDNGGYYHEKFLKGQPELSANLKPCKVKGDGPRKKQSQAPK